MHVQRPARLFVTMVLAASMLVGAVVVPTTPGNAQVTLPLDPLASPCPVGAPERTYAIASLPVPISYNNWGDLDLQGRLFVPAEHAVDLLDDVGTKLSVAGLGSVATPVLELRDAFRAGDIGAAVAAAAGVQDAASSALADPAAASPKGPVDPSALAAPLVLRAHMGECLTIRLLNVLQEPTSVHAHSLVTPPGQGQVVGLQAPDLTETGKVGVYTMYIPRAPGMEGAHFLHSHADARMQTRHGLFGVVAVQEDQATWTSMKDGATPAPFGTAAIISPPGDKSDFREFVQIYHDEVELVDWQLNPLPVISEYGEYGPGTKGINLRSEPFHTRFKNHDAMRDAGIVAREHDKSQSYGSYTYGDPGIDIPISYLGDPVKFRLVNAGPGQHHVHHLHGGGIRWRMTPLAEQSQFDAGLLKHNPIQASASDRRDVQTAGPGESYNLEPEGGSGGVQQSAGDFLFHCHIAEHYLAGMWSFWRVLNTRQADLAELPDRVGDTKWAVDSLGLLGTTLPSGTVLDDDNIDAWIQAMLPPQGVPGEEDASVWDWGVLDTGAGNLYLGEPETALVWPNYEKDAPGRLAPGERPPLLFDPDTGRPAYPMLRPHFGERPPFAPDHGPAPYLSKTVDTDHPDGLCTQQALVRDYNIVAVQAEVPYNKFDTDAAGQVFVRAEDRAAATAPGGEPTSLVLRANAGDCVDVTLTNTLKEKPQTDTRRGVHAKTNLHIHLVQFDVQASDGVVAGFNYETTIRSVEGASKSTDRFDPSAPVVSRIAPGGVSEEDGDTVIAVDDVRPFYDAAKKVKKESLVGIGLGLTTMETARLVDVSPPLPATGSNPVPGTITVRGALQHEHDNDEPIGYEFVRYRWFPDVELGVVYFHDHIDGLNTWRRGLFGSLVVEPAGSRWLSPTRADDSAPDQPTAHIVDVIPPGGQGAFREMVTHFQERACVAPIGDNCLDKGSPEMPDPVKEPAAFNLRSEPLHRRNADDPFASEVPLAVDEAATPYDDTQVRQDDPSTMTLEAYPGDQTMIRLLYAGQSQNRAVASFGVTGHRFPVERNLEGSRTTDVVSVGISDQLNLKLECGAGGCGKQPGDYLYWMTQPDIVERGAWGLLRVHDPDDGTPIQPLPNNAAPEAGTIPAGNVRHYDIAAVQSLVANNMANGMFQTVRRFTLLQPPSMIDFSQPEPLVLRALPGETIEVTLHNQLPDGRVGLHAGMLVAGPADQGVRVGNGAAQTIGPGETITYRWHVDREVGVVDLVSLADPVGDADGGLYGALVVEPAGATFTPATGAASRVTLADGSAVREHVLMMAATDDQFESSTMPYYPDVQGTPTINYRSEPLVERLVVGPPGPGGEFATGAGLGTCHLDAATCMGRPFEVRNPLVPYAMGGIRPETPLVRADQGEPLVLRVVGSAGSQLQTFHVDGHTFAKDPDMPNCRTDHTACDSNLISVVTLGARETYNMWFPEAGAGGAGDYVYRNHRDAYFEAGMWGVLRVT